MSGDVQSLLARTSDGNLVALLLKRVLDPAGDGVLVLMVADTRGCYTALLARAAWRLVVR